MKSGFLIKEISAERKGSGESMKCLMRGVFTKLSEIVTLKLICSIRSWILFQSLHRDSVGVPMFGSSHLSSHICHG